MRENIFESEQEFIKLLEKITGIRTMDHGTTEYCINKENALHIANRNNLIERSEFQQAKDNYYKVADESKNETLIYNRLLIYKDELEKALEESIIKNT